MTTSILVPQKAIPAFWTARENRHCQETNEVVMTPENQRSELEALSPVDGRYSGYTKPLATIFSERGLMHYRIKVEVEYFIALSEHPGIGLRAFSEEENRTVRQLCALSVEEAEIVKAIETTGYGNLKPICHDVKAIEYYLKRKLEGTTLDDCVEWIHFALTSEDINSIAYGLMLSDGMGKIILPQATELYTAMEELAQRYKQLPVLARTHGQPASPTTLGKEFKVYASRLERQLSQWASLEILAKLNGATGNYNAYYAAYPEVDWIAFTQDFVERFNEGRTLKLKPNLITTQIESHDTYAELFDNLRRLNTIVLDFNQDIWRYISDGWIVQKPHEGEIGSSTMPHKVNPIDFENSEGNLGVANALLGFFSTKLPISRLQRDLSDSTVERNFGTALAHSLIGYISTLNGLHKITVNEQKVWEDLENHPEVIAEAIQTVLRSAGAALPYETLKELTRGKKVTTDDLKQFIASLDIPEEIKEKLQGITPANYTGIAQLLVEMK